ncbi:MAG: hypothetical protein DLM58_01660 [Pseudonocardiales bacterium]|nr:MAG: hypothetical protein DLM58_01660 [Pseudonocardiales bacterium]
MMILSVDELRVAAAVIGAGLPTVLDVFATDDLGADAAAARSLVARELATPGADEPLAIELGASLADAVDPLRMPASVHELELDTSLGARLRCAEVRDAAGQLRVLRERSHDIWSLDDVAVISEALAAARPVATGTGAVVELGLAEHAKLDELLADKRYDDVNRLLGERGLFLAEALTDPARTLGRFSFACPVDDDGIALERIAWVSAACGTWVVQDADPDSELAVTTFTPVEPADLVAEIDTMAEAASA